MAKLEKIKIEIPEKLIYQKILNVMTDIEHMSKDGDIEFKTTKYKYLSAEKIVENIRKEMIKQKLIIYPCQCSTDNTDGSQKDITITYKIVAVGDGSFVDVQVTGGGHDSTDKKSYKAMTGAYKYALRQTFMIETGKDDPDRTPSNKGVDGLKDPKLVTAAQLKRYFVLVKEAGKDVDKMDKQIKKLYKVKSKKDLTMTQIDKVFKFLENDIKSKSA